MAEYIPAQLDRVPRPSHESPAQRRATPAQPAHPLLGLQARAGNQAIARLVQRVGEEDELQMRHDPALQRVAEEDELQARHDPALQRVGEEDELQMRHDPALQRVGEEDELQARHDPALQREEAHEEEEEEVQAKHDHTLQRKGEDDLQPRVGLEGGPVGGEIQQRIDSMRGAGSSVPDGIRRQMEAATGSNLGGVRVHEGPEANTLNHQLTAKAFTTGQDIFLRDDQSPADSELMAHELAHVVQQSSGRTSAGSGMTAGAANDPLEAEADSLAHAVLSGTAQRHAEEAQAQA